MPVLSWSTEVPVKQTAREIEEILERHHAQDVGRRGPAADPTAIEFALPVGEGLLRFVLPVDPERVRARLETEYMRGKLDRRHTTPEHARRVAWRQLKRWIESHLELVDGELLSADEAFAPWVRVPDGRPLYRALKESGGLLALPAPREAKSGR